MLMGSLSGHLREGVVMGGGLAPFKEQKLKQETPAGPLGGDSPEDAPGTEVGAGVTEWR